MSTRGGSGNDQTGRERAPRTNITKFIRESKQAKRGWDAQLAELDRALAQQRAAQAQSAATPTPRRAGGNKAPRAAGSAAAAQQRPAATARQSRTARGVVTRAQLQQISDQAYARLQAAQARARSAEQRAARAQTAVNQHNAGTPVYERASRAYATAVRAAGKAIIALQAVRSHPPAQLLRARQILVNAEARLYATARRPSLSDTRRAQVRNAADREAARLAEFDNTHSINTIDGWQVSQQPTTTLAN